MKRLYILFILVFLLTACGGNGSPAAQVTLPPPAVNTTSVPDPQPVVAEFLELWKVEDYPAMYERLTRVSKDAISLDDFTKLFKDTAMSLTLKNFDYTIQSVATEVSSAKAGYTLSYHTNLFTDINTTTEMILALEDGGWKIVWDDSILFLEMKGGNRLRLDSQVPARGDIYDRNGEVIAGQTQAYAIGIVPGEVTSNTTLLRELSALTGRTQAEIRSLYEDAGPDWYIPVGEASADQVNARLDALKSAGGIRLSPYTTRLYYEGGIASQTVGYTLFISKEELEAYKRKGYRGDERIGASGIEKWGDPYLTGKIGGDLYLVAPDGSIITRIASAPAIPSENIFTTLDKYLQLGAEKSIAGFNGAIVVMEMSTGRILAMASSPDFDPNILDPNNVNVSYMTDSPLADPDNPQLNRAAQSSYPPGSVFKVIPMAAALESGLYTKETTYDCKHEFTELPGDPLYDWTYAKELPPSGILNLQEGLMRSCNPWFYHIGLDLFRQNRPKDVSNMARGFGLGTATGIGAVAEDPGSIPDPASDNDAVQLAIGQGAMLVTPLQVVDYFAALGNGGTLYRPQVIEKIGGADTEPTITFTPEVRGTLPIKPETLTDIQEAMRMVVASQRGTARRAFLGLTVPVYGKTGTAQNPAGDPHAWFGGYTFAENPDRPDIAIVVFAENAGEGSEIAAPIFRRMVELYFFGEPNILFPWESSFYVTRTPTSPFTATPEGGAQESTPAP